MARYLSYPIALFVGVVAAATLVQGSISRETQPALSCSALTNATQCTQVAYCCYNQPTQTCYSPTVDSDFDCALLNDENACAVWPSTCAWDQDLGRCLRKPVNTLGNCQAAWTSRTSQRDNTYCWGGSSKTKCVFPFTYNGQTYTSCSTDAWPRGSGSLPWCATDSGPVTSKSTNWDVCECTGSKRPKSVMFFILDDLRPELAIYGRNISKTPYIDELFSRPGSVVFERAYAMFPICAPSRASFLSGLSPDFTGAVSSFGRGLDQKMGFRKTIKTLPQVFRENGFYSAGGGKVYHLHQDDPLSWDKYFFSNRDQNKGACTTDRLRVPLDPSQFVNVKFACQTNTPESQLLDSRMARNANRTLDWIVMNRKEPFFMTLGIFKPHVPFHANKKFWDLYLTDGVPDAERIEGPDSRDSYKVRLTFDLDSEMISPLWRPDTRAQQKYRRTMRMGYMAALSQSDYVIGGMLAKLQELKLTDSTLIAFMGDNGFTIGENGMFGKDTTFELASRVPMAYYVPWLAKPNAQRRIARIPDFFSTLDLLPTLTAMMNVPIDPAFPYHGVSHGPRLALAAANVDESSVPPQRNLAFSQIYRCPSDRCTFAPIRKMNDVGYTVRTDQWRYTAYLKSVLGRAVWDDGPIAEELYVHSDDSQTIFNYKDGANYLTEIVNMAPDNPETCAQLFQLVVQRFNVTYDLQEKLLA